ncbi:MAG: 2-oxoglutarate dehydrogenase E1 component [Planctomycetota bacterium]|nr:2-oxoglutarate dehydrogenase E1 component [Planctomycetota bacterium]
MNVYSRAYIDSLYEDYQQDPSSLPPEWREYFKNFDPTEENNTGEIPVVSPRAVGQQSEQRQVAQLQDRVDQLIRGFRVRGHLEAKVDPLGRPRETNRELNPASYGLLKSDFQQKFSARTIFGENFRTLEEIVDQLRQTYCRSIGVQFMHIDDHGVRSWLQSRMESSRNRMDLSRETQVRILTRLTDAVIFEEFVRKKFVGAKTFSLEGAETLIPLLDLTLEHVAEHGVTDVVIGMAHRGRLNVLANILNKRAQNIFWSFDDPDPELSRGRGDVLYHLGYSSDWKTANDKEVHLSLCFNPSHLEYVDPVAVGRCRAKQDRAQDINREKGLTILIHGDAAFAGEGIVQETLNLSQLNAYSTGGTLHVIVNNQLGFTTEPELGRSTTYASDVAKMLQIPIFHVNGEDPEAVAQVVSLAMEFRNEFHRDVVIDMYCYRRLGHNESDEPRFTQPGMYKVIDNRPTIRDSYLERMLRMDKISQNEADSIAEVRRRELQEEFDSARAREFTSDAQVGGGYWKGFYGGLERDDDNVDTGVPMGKLTYVIKQLSELPPDFNINRKLERILKTRKEMAEGKRPVDWATAELAAFGSLAVEGHRVRMSGQDSGRGTFSQRHAVLADHMTGRTYTPLQHISDDQAPVEIFNSPLSEGSVLGFEYGYSLDAPESLVCWEAQFGDFWNCAQVIVDQFITSAEDKWARLSGLTMLLPHGFEGAGPEHCSARVERFLTLAAEHNIQIVNPTSAAQHFHLLRRQVKRPWRKPLIILTPKSLLREPFVMSKLDEFYSGTFQRVIGDSDVGEQDAPQRIILASGKIGVELLKERAKAERTDVAIIRLEQLYPLPYQQIQEILESYPEGTPTYWVQEEPSNMGAWYFMKVKWDEFGLSKNWPLQIISRPESASPSTGSKKTHIIEQEELMREALGSPLVRIAKA